MRYLLIMLLFISFTATAQKHLTRLAKLEINSVQLEAYKALLKEEIETSVKIEKGVLTLYAVFEKEHPTRVTILEIYEDSAAYRSHIQTAHFLKYKNETQNMVRALQLVEVDPLIPEMKIK